MYLPISPLPNLRTCSVQIKIMQIQYRCRSRQCHLITVKCRKMFDKNSMDSLVGPLIPEITVKYVAVFLIFFNSGLSLRTEVNKKCSHHSCAWRLKGYYLTFHFSQQEQLGAFFTYMSLIICFYIFIDRTQSGRLLKSGSTRTYRVSLQGWSLLFFIQSPIYLHTVLLTHGF